MKLTLKGKTIILIDWANMYAQQRKLGWQIDVKKMYQYLNTYQEIQRIIFFHGTDNESEKSILFLKQCESIGYEIITKPVKYIRNKDGSTFRKCDFDIEISKEMFLGVDTYDHFVLFSGDGDFKCPIEYILEKEKYTTVISGSFALGKEIKIIKEQQKKQIKDPYNHHIWIISLQKAKDILTK